jgi:hypothetical protein
MGGRNNTHQNYKHDDQPYEQYQFHNSAQTQPEQIQMSQYLNTNHTQDFTELEVDSQVEDVLMSDLPLPHLGYLAMPTGGYNGNWYPHQKRAASVGTATTSFVNVGTLGTTTDGGHSSYVMVPSRSRTYSENSGSSGQYLDSPLYSVPGDDPGPWIDGSKFEVDQAAMLEDARYDQNGALAGLSSSRRFLLDLFHQVIGSRIQNRGRMSL